MKSQSALRAPVHVGQQHETGIIATAHRQILDAGGISINGTLAGPSIAW
jgi:hypothetical protein